MSDKNITLAPEPGDESDLQRPLTEEELASSLDAESYEVVQAVLYRDTADDREGVARAFTAQARTEIERLKKTQGRIGKREQMQAIRRTGACPDARFWLIAAWSLVLLDAVFWFIASAQAFAF
jgi:hypothetical protein